MTAKRRPVAVLVYAYTPDYHPVHTGSREGRCSVHEPEGGFCNLPPEFSVVADRYDVAACASHLHDAVRRGAGPRPRRRGQYTRFAVGAQR